MKEFFNHLTRSKTSKATSPDRISRAGNTAILYFTFLYFSIEFADAACSF